jgi:hypothetical protein
MVMSSLQAEVLRPDEVRALAVPVLQKHLGRYGFRAASVIDEDLFYGGTAIRIIADVDQKVPADDLAETSAALRAMLRPRGEQRFVFLVARRPAAPGDDDQDDEG